jgi:membrane associated rhomboid family serine protease
MPVKFIWLNVGVYVALALLQVIARLFLTSSSVALYLETPSSLSLLALRPWTVLTYMFVHFNFLHILFNMLWLYWFGNIFMQFFTGRQLSGLYILGGFAGAALYLLCYNTLPYFRLAAEYSFLCGASASVMAIVFAVAFSQKDYVINLLIIGRVKLLWLAIAVLVLDVIAITSENAGGHIAHIGGALFGVLFAVRYRKGKDVTRGLNRGIDRVVDFFKMRVGNPDRSGQAPHSWFGRVTNPHSWRVTNPHSRMKAERGGRQRPESDDEYLRRRNEEMRIIDEILDKLKRSGYESLSAAEKKRLFDASKN